ncbi:MAG TPA: glutathione synthase [Candidatus Binatia bacterium]
MILLCGIPTESPLAMVRNALDDINAPHIVFNQRRFADCAIDFQIAAGGITGMLTVDGDGYDLGCISAVYTRMMNEELLPEFRTSSPDSAQRTRCRRLHDALTRWLEIAEARVINRCNPMASNSSKPYQAQLIATYGFAVPDTLITNDPEMVRSFHAHHGPVIYKSISGARSIVHQLTETDLERLEQIRWCPTQFQSFVPGTNVRVHVVGKEAFATKILSDATDYRYAERDGCRADLSPFELTDELAGKCVRLAAGLNLPLAGIDLKITPAGDVFCFEVNPSPAFSFFETSTGQPIAKAIAHYLNESE